MNKEQIREYLAQKDILWQIMFGIFYLAEHHLHKTLSYRRFNISDAVTFCKDSDDIEHLLDLIKWLDTNDGRILQKSIRIPR